MSDTYTQIHIHLIFAVQNRISMIKSDFRDRLYNYIIAIIQNKNHKVISIGGMEDHVHILFGLRPNQALSELVKDVKINSTKWLNNEVFTFGKFAWQEGYGAFSYGKSQLPDVIHYIENQEKHHKKQTLQEEYKTFLDSFGVEYDDKYIFQTLL